MDFFAYNEENLLKRAPLPAGVAPKGLPVPDCIVDLTELIRSIQRSEGKPDCFRRSSGTCDLEACAWRSLCLEQQDLTDSHNKDNPPD
jgi:hypothetical protein